MQKWEYLECRPDFSSNTMYLNDQRIKWDWGKKTQQSALNEFGEQGWELVSVVHSVGGNSFYFKRPKP